MVGGMCIVGNGVINHTIIFGRCQQKNDFFIFAKCPTVLYCQPRAQISDSGFLISLFILLHFYIMAHRL